MASTNTSDYFGGNGGTAFTQGCPAGSYVTGIGTRAGAWMDAIAMQCSDGTKLPASGGPGGAVLPPALCPGGFDKIAVTADSEKVSYVTPYCEGSAMGKLGGSGNYTEFPPFACPPGSVLSGLDGRGSPYVNALRFTCAPKSSP